MEHRPAQPFRPIGLLCALAVLAALVVSGPASNAANVAQNKIVNPNPANWTPNVLDGQVNSIVQIGNKIFAGGQFTQVQASSGGTIYSRSNLFSFDATTGAIDTSFAPSFDAAVKALAVGPDGNLFVGGYFNAVNGDTTVTKLVKLNPTNGQRISTFSANANGQVWDIKVSGNRLIVGGKFTSIKNVAKDRLAAVDVNTGAVDTTFGFSITDPHTSTSVPWVYSMDVSPDGSRLVIIGNFMKVNGQSRPQVALIDLSTSPATLANWQTDRYVPPCFSNAFDTYMRDVDFSPDGSYFVIVATGGPNIGTLCDAAARWNTAATGSALEPAWVDVTGGDTLSAVAITGSVVYVGGHQRWLNNYYGSDFAGPGAIGRPGVAALDPTNGLPFSWNPTKDKGIGVFAFLATSEGLWMGSDTDHVAGETRRKIAFFPLAGGKTPPPTDPYTVPGDLYNVPTSGPVNSLARRTFDGSALGTTSSVSTPATDWSTTRGMFALQGVLYSGSTDGKFYARTFDGSSVGPAQQINLNGLTDFPVQSLTGMFYANGGIYYTVEGDTQMYYRYFTPESQILGSYRFTVGTLTPAVDWSSVRGMTLANGKLYFARTNGNLYSMDFANGAPVGSTETLVSPKSAGYDWASNGLFVFTHTDVDTDAPTAPGKPTGSSPGTGTITINWAASQDASPPITYRVYRDGGLGTPINQTTSTTFTDTGLAPGSQHTYTVDAVDKFNNGPTLGATSDPITVTSAIFADDFSSGDFSRWTGVTRMTIDPGSGGVAPPSARAQTTAQSGFAYKNLAATYSSVCMSANVNAYSLDANSPTLLRLRTAANGAIAKIFVNASGILYVRSDAANTQIFSGVALGSGWHNIEVCGTVGTSGTWNLYRDGVKIVNAWTANTGTTPVGRVEIGNASSITSTINFDDVVVDQTVG